MTPALVALLFKTGLVVGGAQVFVVRPSADPQEVKNRALDAGFVARAAEAEFQVTPEGVAWLADAGITAPTYARLQFPVGVGVGLGSGGGNAVILPHLPFQRIRQVELSNFDVATCTARPNVCPLYGSARPFRVTPQLCAWKPTSGATCGRINPDGGAALDPGVENTMQPGAWVGAGCVRKSCVEISGISSAP